MSTQEEHGFDGKLIFQTSGEDISFQKAECVWLAADTQASFNFQGLKQGPGKGEGECHVIKL